MFKKEMPLTDLADLQTLRDDHIVAFHHQFCILFDETLHQKSTIFYFMQMPIEVLLLTGLKANFDCQE